MRMVASSEGVSERTVKNWVDSGIGGIKLQSQLRGRRRMIKASWVEEFHRRIDAAKAACRIRGGKKAGKVSAKEQSILKKKGLL